MSPSTSIFKIVLVSCFVLSFYLIVNAKEKPANEMDYSLYAELLAAYTNEEGFVNYKGLKADQAKLEQFVQSMNDVPVEEYESWNIQTKIAFWCNAYNVFTLKAIADHYPIQAGLINGFRFPKNSIRQISGVWTKLKFGAVGKEVTLNQIEHEILRVQFVEPRIHFAINCASVGCPPLRSEPFSGATLNAQLADQTKRFLSNPQNYRINKENEVVHLSSIFSWFGEDFTKTHATNDHFKHLGTTERAVIHFITEYVNEEDKAYLETQNYNISYTNYEWTLNEQS